MNSNDTGNNSKSNADDDKEGAAAKTGAALGWVVSLGAGLARLPQIGRILQARSVEGLSPLMFKADAICNAISALYHRAKG